MKKTNQTDLFYSPGLPPIDLHEKRELTMQALQGPLPELFECECTGYIRAYSESQKLKLKALLHRAKAKLSTDKPFDCRSMSETYICIALDSVATDESDQWISNVVAECIESWLLDYATLGDYMKRDLKFRAMHNVAILKLTHKRRLEWLDKIIEYVEGI